MIVIAIVRVALAPIPTLQGKRIPDTIWLFFWQSMEACVAMIMVSLTAFRGLYGQERARSGRSKNSTSTAWSNESPVQQPRHIFGSREARGFRDSHRGGGPESDIELGKGPLAQDTRTSESVCICVSNDSSGK